MSSDDIRADNDEICMYFENLSNGFTFFWREITNFGVKFAHQSGVSST